MDEFKNIGIIPPKDKDSVNRSLFIKPFCLIFFPIAFLAIPFLGFLKGLLISFGISLISTLLIMYIAEKFSNVAKILFGGRNNIITKREQLQSVLNTARNAIMHKDYTKAIKIVNNILQQDPEFYEAMFVKAQILNEGFNKTDIAKKYLKKVIANTQPNEDVHVWSSTLYEQIESAQL